MDVFSSFSRIVSTASSPRRRDAFVPSLNTARSSIARAVRASSRRPVVPSSSSRRRRPVPSSRRRRPHRASRRATGRAAPTANRHRERPASASAHLDVGEPPSPMVDLHRAHTIHEDYARNHKLFKLPRTSLGALCVASGVGVATYYAFRSFVTSTQSNASTGTTGMTKHEEVWRSSWDKGSPRKHVNNLWNDPAK
jgi:hypothetical protein